VTTKEDEVFIVKKTTVIGLLLILSMTLAGAREIKVGGEKVVKVNNRIITDNELNKEFDKRSKLPSLDGQPVTRKSVLQSMIDEELLRNEIQNKNIVVDENQVEQMLQQYKMMYMQQMVQTNPEFQFDEEAYKQYLLKEIKITYDKFQERVRETVMVRQYIVKRAEQKLQAAAEKSYSQSKIEDFYDTNIGEFVVPKSVELKHIFLQTIGPDGRMLPDSEKVIVKKRAQDILTRLKKGEDFAELCELNTDDPESRDMINPKTNKLDRGYLGILTKKDDMARQQFGDKTFNALFDLKKGQYSPVLESTVGYHVFYVVDKKSQYIMSLEDARGEIVKYFRLMEQEEIVKNEFQDVLKDLRKRATVVYYKDEYKS
jgi:foldase protein PrsA